MTDAFRAIIETYRENHPQIKVLANYASSGSLAKQISQGAPSDLYISANPKWVDYLTEHGFLDNSSKRTAAYTSLVFVGSPDLKITELSQIVSLDRISIGTPQSVPAGQYARQAMEKADIYQNLESRRKLVFAKDVRQALLYADRGVVDGAFVYRTDAMLAKNARILFEVPATHYDRVTYPLALTKKGAEKKEAIEFLQFINTAQVKTLLETYGFEPAE